ncbi:CLUMA_CG011843, isoform A [Clunio marinus]|uniref:CLUMA_CG011843, isoform A n=1 Tax=Clunio marinus TaxID=568069 RepID=A0A1J1IHH7_9DIPT|nr:CLUMA_CG011843, isoform A [Clunio marinus]
MKITSLTRAFLQYATSKISFCFEKVSIRFEKRCWRFLWEEVKRVELNSDSQWENVKENDLSIHFKIGIYENMCRFMCCFKVQCQCIKKL